MPSTSRRPLAHPVPSSSTAWLLLATAAGVALTNAGCGQTACIQWSENERISPTQICPARDQALKLFGTCTDITAVNDDGAYANDLCCYSVTKEGATPAERGCAFTSTSTITGPPVVVTSFAVSTSFASTSVGPSTCDAEPTCGDTGTGCIGCALNGPCHGELDNCTSNMACVSFLNCLNACAPSDGACADACGTKEPEGFKLYTAMITCSVCNQCPNACFSMAAKSCAGTSSSSASASTTGGAGGMGGG